MGVRSGESCQAGYTRQSQTQLTNDDKQLRIRYWDCRENANNDIVRQDDGTSQFKDFTFVPKDAAAGGKPEAAKTK